MKIGCAIWGTGGAAHDVYYNIASFRDAEGLILLQWKQKTGFHRKTVLSPERLQELNVNKVFCLVANTNFAEIKKRLEEIAVRAVWIYEILLED